MSVCVGCGFPFNGNHPEQHCHVPNRETTESRVLNAQRQQYESHTRQIAAFNNVFRWPGEVGFTQMRALTYAAMSPHFSAHEQRVAKLQFDAWARNT